MIRWANTIGPETVEKLNGRVVQPARSLKATRGRKLRVDTTAVETDIHFLTDSGLVGEGVRVVSRLLRCAKAALGEAASGLKEAFRSGVRSVRKLKVLPRLKRAVGQAERRVLKGDPVPSSEKLASVFEPHTQVIPRFKAGKPAEFGRKPRLDEVEGGIDTGYRVLEKGGGQDQEHLGDALTDHRRKFGRPPRLLAADRGMASAEDERLAMEAGVAHAALPHVGKAPPERRAEEKGR